MEFQWSCIVVCKIDLSTYLKYIDAIKKQISIHSNHVHCLDLKQSNRLGTVILFLFLQQLLIPQKVLKIFLLFSTLKIYWYKSIEALTINKYLFKACKLENINCNK